MSQPSALESQMLALINEERTQRGLDALVFDGLLNASSEDHSEWIQSSGVFSHTGQGGSSATQRMRDAGFVFQGSWRSAENIAYQSERGAGGYEDDVVMLHNGLMNSPGHRANILNPSLTSIGIGIETGSSALGNFDAVIVTQNFATSAAANQPIIEFVDAVEAPTVDAAPATSSPTPKTPKQEAPASAPDTSNSPAKEVSEDTKPASATTKQQPKADTAQPGKTAPADIDDLPSRVGEKLAQLEKKAEKFQGRVDMWEARAEAEPAEAGKALARADAWSARLDKLETRLETWVDRQVSRIERQAERTADTSDDAAAAASRSLICEEIDSWQVTWSAEFCDVV